MKTIRQLCLQFLVLAITMSGSLVAAELVLRIKNSSGQNYDIEMWRYAKELKIRSDIDAISHEHIRDSRAFLQNVEIRTNEYGLRGGPVPAARPGQRRILFLGSSITLGWGVDEKETLTSRVEAMFREDKLGAIVFNAGIGNYNTVRYVELFLNRLTVLKPTDIVIHFFVNDAETLPPGGGNFLLRNSELAVTLWRAIHRLVDRTGETSLESHYRDVYRPEAKGYQDMLMALDRLKSYTDAHGIRVYLAMQPDVHNLINYRFGFIHQRMAAISGERGFRYIDLLPIFMGKTPATIWAMPGDPHPNAYGHKLMADAIYPALKTE